MSDISKEDLRKEIDGILEGADLDTLSSKKVRQQLEEKLKFDLTDRKKEIDELVMEAVENKPTEDGAEKKKKIADDSGDENDEEKEKEPAKKKVKGDKSDESDDEEEEANDAESVEEKGEEEEDEEEEDEYQPDGDDSPKRKGRQGSRQSSRKSPAEPEAKRGRPSRSDINKKSLAENSSESEEEKSAESEESEESDAAPAPAPAGKKRGPKPKAARKSEDAVQKPAKVARQEYSDSEFEEFDEDSTNSSDHASDDDYAPGKKSPGKKKAAGRGGRGRGTPGRKRKMDSTDPEDSDEDWKKATQRKRTPNAKKGEGTPKPRANKAVKLSAELSDIIGVDAMSRPEVIKKMWSIIKERNLYDPKNKQFALCDEQLLKVFGVKRFRTFSMMKYLKTHFTD